MKLRKRYLPFIALLGAAAAVIPSMGSSSAATPSTATVSGLESIMWSPMEVTITAGGSVVFQDTSGSIPHGVVWESGAPETPACSGVPIDEGKTDWKGSCTFQREGTYQYYCYVHGMHMSGTINVVSAATTTSSPTTTSSTPTTTTTTTTSTTTSTSTTTMPGMTMSGGQGTSSQSGGMGATTPTPGAHAAPVKDSLGAGVLRLALSQRGSVRGSLEVAQANSRLQVELLVSAAALRTRGAATVVGRLLETKLAAGRVTFTVALAHGAKRALQRLGRLEITVKVFLTPPAGARIARTLKVALLK
jgi:plastocyanin